MFPWQILKYNNDRRCFLRGPCRGVINGKTFGFYKILKIGIVCFVKRELTEDLYTTNRRIFNNILCMRYVTLDERPSIFIRDKPFSRQRGGYIRTMVARVQLKKNSGCESQSS
jgi:hypothetical protein